MYDKTKPYYGKINSSNRVAFEGMPIGKQISQLDGFSCPFCSRLMIKNTAKVSLGYKNVYIYNLYVCIYIISRIKSLSFAARNFISH